MKNQQEFYNKEREVFTFINYKHTGQREFKVCEIDKQNFGNNGGREYAEHIVKCCNGYEALIKQNADLKKALSGAYGTLSAMQSYCNEQSETFEGNDEQLKEIAKILTN